MCNDPNCAVIIRYKCEACGMQGTYFATGVFEVKCPGCGCPAKAEVQIREKRP